MEAQLSAEHSERVTAPLPFHPFRSKLTPPFARAGLVERGAILDRLSAERGTPLVAVVAPAGYGKSTLLRHWIERDGRPSAWVTLDADDNDPVVLLSYLAVALDSVSPVDPELLRLLAVEHPSVRGVTHRLCGELAAWPRDGGLVLDDVHVLENPSCRDIVGMLAEHVPSGSQLALASRGELPLPMARHRGEGRVVEIGPDDLALDADEATSLLRGVDVKWSKAEASAIVDIAEGWPVAIYLIGRSVKARGADGSADLARVGQRREIVEYVNAELLAALSPEMVGFLTRSSVLEQMSGPLCDAVLQTTGSGAQLEDLAQSNLLLTPLDEGRASYRYHQLFRELLRAELQHREPALIPELNRRAAGWCEVNGLPDAAIDYAMAAGDADHVVRIVRERMLPVYRAGRVATLNRWFGWLERFGHLPRYPRVAVGAAWLGALTGRVGAAEQWADAAERYAHDHPVLDDHDGLRGELALLRVVLCRQGVDAALIDADTAERLIPTDNPWRVIALVMAGIIRLVAGSPDAADATFVQVVEMGRDASAPAATSVALAQRALIALDRGDQDAARDLAGAAYELVGDGSMQDLVTNVLVFAVSARIATRAGDVAQAKKVLTQAQRLRPSLTYAIPHLAVQARLELVRTLLQLSDVPGARTLLREVDDIVRVRPDLGVLVEHTQKLRAQMAGAPLGAVGASTLTAAELRLLPQLRTHLTFREIGERLFVSRHTVKTQAISIYRKLGVSSRSDAVRVASEIGLLHG